MRPLQIAILCLLSALCLAAFNNCAAAPIEQGTAEFYTTAPGCTQAQVEAFLETVDEEPNGNDPAVFEFMVDEYESQFYCSLETLPRPTPTPAPKKKVRK